MKTARGRVGKISEHFGGLGTVTPEMVETRARELAIINGRKADNFTQDDWAQAKREMTGDEEGEEPSGQIPEGTGATLTRWDEGADAAGHHVENTPLPDEQTVAEHLVQEGIEEANHEQMLGGSRQNSSAGE